MYVSADGDGAFLLGASARRRPTGTRGATYNGLYIGLFGQDFAGLPRLASALIGVDRSDTFSQRRCTSFSSSCLHFIKSSIHESSVGMDAGSVSGTTDACIGSVIFTSSMLTSMARARLAMTALRRQRGAAQGCAGGSSQREWGAGTGFDARRAGAAGRDGPRRAQGERDGKRKEG